MNHFRVSLGGNTILSACSPLYLFIPWEELSIQNVKFEFWARDVKIISNMSTSVWLDFYSAINISVLQMDDDSVVEMESIISELDAMEDPKSLPGLPLQEARVHPTYILRTSPPPREPVLWIQPFHSKSLQAKPCN